jgi:hypothetical protein
VSLAAGGMLPLHCDSAIGSRRLQGSSGGYSLYCLICVNPSPGVAADGPDTAAELHAAVGLRFVVCRSYWQLATFSETDVGTKHAPVLLRLPFALILSKHNELRAHVHCT